MRHLATPDRSDSTRRDPRPADVELVEPRGDGIQRVDFDPLGDTRLIADQPAEPRPEGVRQRIGECGEEDAGVGIGAGEM